MGQGSRYFAERPGRRESEIASLRLGLDLGLGVMSTAEKYSRGAGPIRFPPMLERCLVVPCRRL